MIQIHNYIFGLASYAVLHNKYATDEELDAYVSHQATLPTTGSTSKYIKKLLIYMLLIMNHIKSYEQNTNTT